jgi:hypothetical protein
MLLAVYQANAIDPKSSLAIFIVHEDCFHGPPFVQMMIQQRFEEGMAGGQEFRVLFLGGVPVEGHADIVLLSLDKIATFAESGLPEVEAEDFCFPLFRMVLAAENTHSRLGKSLDIPGDQAALLGDELLLFDSGNVHVVLDKGILPEDSLVLFHPGFYFGFGSFQLERGSAEYGIHDDLLEVDIFEEGSDDVVDAFAEPLPHPFELFQESFQDVAFAGFRIEHIEDEAFAGLAVTVDPAHALLEAVGIPGEVVVDHEAAELEVQTLAGRFGCYHDLRVIAEASFLGDAFGQAHLSVNDRRSEAPSLESPLEGIEGVFELGENKQLFVGVVAEILLDDPPEFLNFGFFASLFHLGCKADEFLQFPHFGSQLLRRAGGGEGLEVFQKIFPVFCRPIACLLVELFLDRLHLLVEEIAIPFVEEILQLLPPASQRFANGIEARSKTSLEDGEGEGDVSASGVLPPVNLSIPTANVVCDPVVEFSFGGAELDT